MTTLVRWNPTRNMRRMHSDIDRLMESFFETPRVSGSKSTTGGLPVDVAESADSYVISAPVPGLKSEDIDITVEDGVLSISGAFNHSYGSTENADETETAAVKLHIQERRYGSFARKLRLPKDVDGEGIEAKQEDGILTITLPKSEAAQPKKITVS